MCWNRIEIFFPTRYHRLFLAVTFSSSWLENVSWGSAVSCVVSLHQPLISVNMILLGVEKMEISDQLSHLALLVPIVYM